MSGFPIEKAKETMKLALDNLYPYDTFNLITFAGDEHILFPGPVPATKENLRKAQEFLERIDRFNPRPEVDRDMAQLFRWRAQWRLSQGLDPRAEIARGLALARKALDRNPKMSDARAIEGALSLVQAKASEPPEARAAAGKAAALLQQALQENFLLRNAYGNELEDARRLGR